MAVDKYRRSLKTGEILFREGDRGDCAYLVESGQLEVYRASRGRREVIGRAGPGDVVGEMAVMDALPRAASAVARRPTRLRVITPQLLQGKLDSADPLVRVLLELIMKRYRAAMFSSTGTARRPRTDRKRALARIQRLQELEEALDRERFQVWYQPVVELHNMAIAGFEALVRLDAGRGRVIGPAEFVPIMEGTELVHRLGRWVLENACAALARLSRAPRAHRRQPLFMSVNLSGREFGAPDLLERLRGVLRRTGVPPGSLKLEITESALVEDLGHAVEKVARLRRLGVRVAVDDFGTGYSSLNYLQQFDVDTLKIDRSFVTPLGKSEDSLSILRTIRALAQALDMTVIAEGVETERQAGVLRELDVEYAQGWLFSRAVREREAQALLASPWPWRFERRTRERRAGTGRRRAPARAT